MSFAEPCEDRISLQTPAFLAKSALNLDHYYKLFSKAKVAIYGGHKLTWQGLFEKPAWLPTNYRGRESTSERPCICPGLSYHQLIGPISRIVIHVTYPGGRQPNDGAFPTSKFHLDSSNSTSSHVTTHDRTSMPSFGAGALSKNSITTHTAGIQAFPPNKRLSLFHKLPAPPCINSPIQILPAELLLSIAVYLTPIDQASLALTCRSLGLGLGPPAWKLTSKAGEASWYKHADMLDLLQRDLHSEQWWRCKQCEMFHSRKKKAENEALRGFLGRHLRLSGIMGASMRNEGGSLQIGLQDYPVYILDFSLLKAVMDRHFLGAAHGVCLNTLKCQGTRTSLLSKASEIVLKYDFAPKIVLDKLLLQSTYTFRPQPTMFLQKVKVDKPSVQDFLDQLQFQICSHDMASDIFQNSKPEIVNPFAETVRKCPYCPTQSQVGYNLHEELIIRVWQNFGPGRSPKDSEWLHMLKSGKEARKYGREKADIRTAYEKIFCSTKDEFELQLERSDGQGNWYGPGFMKPVYKTLPAKVADYL
ncbi:uncharacterized protein BDR25DRAFT_359911 [Lindgomyces ingoldianus]|uniref:Uncharacterized protein n=1 Tax=Lindgomyces ingoldianus TaxID=673940 RepID=A0ACB6QGW7_9PLEO|nr:uncharacterized protein BDR25DRAFT_359911 [Lindgomyces ingoldianus]KAF2466125.1 hypothetical protein BDR25DRAFT_359911 [Lindgomyces ingoldianus]